MREFTEFDIELLNEIFPASIRERLRKVGMFVAHARLAGARVRYNEEDGDLRVHAPLSVVVALYKKAKAAMIDADWVGCDPQTVDEPDEDDLTFAFPPLPTCCYT